MLLKAYKVLLKARDATIGALRPGNVMVAVYKAAYTVVEAGGTEFMAFFTKNAGTGIGIEFRESGLTLKTKNDRVIRAGIVFNVSLGFHKLTTESWNEKSRTFLLLVANKAIYGSRLMFKVQGFMVQLFVSSSSIFLWKYRS